MAGIENSYTEKSYRIVVVSLIRRLAGMPKPLRWPLIMILALEALGIGLGVLGPFALKSLIDGFGAHEFSGLTGIALAGLFVAAWAGGGMLSSWRMVYSARIIDSLAGQMIQSALSGEMQRVVTSKASDSGRTLGLLERMPYSLTIVLDGLMWRTVPLAIQIVLSVWIIAGFIPAHYAVVLASVLAVYGVLAWRGAVRHQTYANIFNMASASVSRNIADLLRNARRVVINGALKLELDRLTGTVDEKARTNQRMMWSMVATASVQYGWLGLGLLALLAAAVGDVLAHRMSIGDFVMLETYALRLALPISSIGFILSQSASSIGTIEEVLRLEPTHQSAPADVSRPDRRPARIELDDVAFTYANSASGISGITATLAPGSFTVIVGPNGSGKSTLAQVMAGLFVPSSGSVRIEGQELAAIPRDQRHNWVLYVPQFITLLDRSLGANALYPPTSMTEGDLSDLLRQWQFYAAGQEVDYEQQVGEMGERLSGGQIQKLELARIAGVNLPAVILDESTSALDPASEDRVITELRRRFRGRTTLVLVTHHEGVVEQADNVLFMKAGRLAAQGTHSELISAREDYRQLWSAS